MQYLNTNVRLNPLTIKKLNGDDFSKNEKYSCIYIHVYYCVHYFNFQEGDGCPQSIPTENVVEACPADSTEWIKAKEKKLCHLVIQNCTDKDRFQYHCLPNKFLDILVEVCAPNKVIVGKIDLEF